MPNFLKNKKTFILFLTLLSVSALTLINMGGSVSAANAPTGCAGNNQAGPKNPSTDCPGGESSNPVISDGALTAEGRKQGFVDVCGSGNEAVPVKFNFGCSGQVGNPIEDLFLVLIRFLSVGVGVIVIAAIVWSGIQYSTAEGNPEQSAAAKNHIQSAIIGLFIYLFIFAAVQYLVPGGVFN